MEDRPLHSVYPPQIENMAGLNDSTKAGSAVSIKASLSKFDCFSFKKNQNFQQTCSLLPHHLISCLISFRVPPLRVSLPDELFVSLH